MIEAGPNATANPSTKAKETSMTGSTSRKAPLQLNRNLILSLTNDEHRALITLLQNGQIDAGSNIAARTYAKILKQLTSHHRPTTQIVLMDHMVDAAAQALAKALFVNWDSLPPEDPDPSPWRDILHFSAGKAEYTRAARQIVEAFFDARPRN
jgi:hypothetical protein